MDRGLNKLMTLVKRRNVHSELSNCSRFPKDCPMIRSRLQFGVTFTVAPGSVSYSIQAQLHHEQLSGGPCTGVPDRVMPLRE